nr:histidine kinase [uncultured Acetatifactor sp.]
MKIRFKTFLYAGTIGAFIVVLLIGFVLISKLTVQQIQNRISDITVKVFEQGEINIRNKMEIYEQDIAELIASPNVEKFLNEDYAWDYQKIVNDRKCIRLFNSIIGKDPSIFGIFVLDKENRILGTTVDRTVSGEVEPCELEEGMQKGWSSLAGWDFFTENNILKELVEGQSLNINVQPLYYRGEVSWLMLLVNEEVISEEYRQLVYNESVIMIVDSRGMVISCNDKARIGSRIGYLDLLQEQEGERLRILSHVDDAEIICYRTDINDWYFINVVPTDTYKQTEKQISGIILAIGSFIVVFLCLFLHYIIQKFINPLNGLMAGMNEVANGNLEVRIGKESRILEFDHMNGNFNYMVEKINDLIRKIEQAEEEKRISSINFLQYQMNPHFLYNTINSIRWMAMAADVPNVADSLLKLVEIIQPILRNPSLTWKFRDEIAFVTKYMELLELRFGRRMEVYQSYDEGLDDLEFPKFVLQPIIENCFMHSEMTDASLKIYIDVHLEETGHLNLKIQNSGPRISEERVKQINEDLSKEPKDGARIGMRNVYQRLQLLYYSAAKMKFYCDENIVVEIRLPLDGLGYSGNAR